MFIESCGDSYCGAVSKVGGLAGRVMWCDAEANLWALSTREGVRDTVQRCKECGINTVVVDVKPLAGVVLYNSKIAPCLSEWEGKPYPEDYDLLKTMVEECREAGIEVHAAINVFAEGSQARNDGPAYSHPEWQCVKYEVEKDGSPRFVRVADSSAEHLAVFVNPAMPEVRDYELSIVDEIVRNYDVDGIILDRMRYPNLYSDFSDFSRERFESWLGTKVAKWPVDIFKLESDGKVERGKLYNKWIEWRARNITTFLEDVRRVVKGIRQEAMVSVYVGSWYAHYYNEGVNWASRDYMPPYDWASESYNQTGYAHLVDFMCTGCYYENATRAEARARGESAGATVEAAGEESVEVVKDDTFVYGSLYVLQYAAKPLEFVKAIEACLATTQGVMIFDLCYIRDYDWWSVLKDCFKAPAIPPHDVPGLAQKAKDIRKLIEITGLTR